MPDTTTDQQLQDLILRLPDGPARRAAEVEKQIRAALKDPEPDSRRARNLAMHFVQGELNKKRRHGLIAASLIEVQLAGTFLGVATQVHDWVPDRPDGSWPPDGPALTRVFARNLAATLKGDQE